MYILYSYCRSKKEDMTINILANRPFNMCTNLMIDRGENYRMIHWAKRFLLWILRPKKI